jgi:hypothetical protein
LAKQLSELKAETAQMTRPVVIASDLKVPNRFKKVERSIEKLHKNIFTKKIELK